MAPTYITRKRSDLQKALRHNREEDLLRKAEMLSASPDPDNIFSYNTIRKSTPFGVLVLFGTNGELNLEMPVAPRCDNLDHVEHLIHVLQAYPPVSDEFFEEKRQAFLKDYNRLIHVMNSPAHSDKERQRLENAVRNADIQKAWLERENTDRMQRVKAIEEEIAKYEAELKDASFSEEAAQKIQKVRDATGPLEQKLKDDTAKLKELSDTIDNLHVEQALVDKDVSPTTARLLEMEEKRLDGERESLTGKIKATEVRLKQLEDAIRMMEEKAAENHNKAELEDTLNQSRKNLETAKNELDGGTKMLENLDLKVQILGGRLKAIAEGNQEDRENARIAVLARAEDLLNAWISSSKNLKRILNVDGVSPEELMEALFFANGPMCACGEGACAYLDTTNISLDTLMLYGTEEEHAGFWHTEVFR